MSVILWQTRGRWVCSLPSHLSVLDLHLPEGLLIQVNGELLSEGDDADGPVAQHGAQDGGEEAVALLALRGRLRHLLPLLLLLLLQHLPPPRHLCPQLRHQVCGQHVQLGLWTGGDRGMSIGANVQVGLWTGEIGARVSVPMSSWVCGEGKMGVHVHQCQCLDGSMERRWVCRCECHCPDGSVDRGTQRHEYRCQCPAGSMGRGRWVCVCVNVQLSLWTEGDGGACVSVTVQMGLWTSRGNMLARINASFTHPLLFCYNKPKCSFGLTWLDSKKEQKMICSGENLITHRQWSPLVTKPPGPTPTITPDFQMPKRSPHLKFQSTQHHGPFHWCRTSAAWCAVVRTPCRRPEVGGVWRPRRPTARCACGRHSAGWRAPGGSSAGRGPAASVVDALPGSVEERQHNQLGCHTAPLFDPVLVSQKSLLFQPVLVSQKSPLFQPVLVSQKSPLFDPVLVSQKSPLFDTILVSQKSPLFDQVLVSQKSPLFDPVLVSQYFNQSLLVTNLHYLNQTSTLLTKQASHKSLLFQAALVSPLL